MFSAQKHAKLHLVDSLSLCTPISSCLIEGNFSFNFSSSGYGMVSIPIEHYQVSLIVTENAAVPPLDKLSYIYLSENLFFYTASLVMLVSNEYFLYRPCEIKKRIF